MGELYTAEVRYDALDLLRSNGNLEGTSRSHLVKSALVICQWEDVGTFISTLRVVTGIDLHHTGRLDLSRVEKVNGSWETISLGEGSNDAIVSQGKTRYIKPLT